MVGSLQVIVSARKYAITCVSRNGLVCGMKFWYQFWSDTISIVIVFGNFLIANLAQYMVV